MLLVKFGGSVITDKRRYRTLRRTDLARLARELAGAADSDRILVHGAGSFGHVLAAKHRLRQGLRDDDQVSAAAQVLRDVRALNLEVLDACLGAGLRPVAIPPSAAMRLRGGKVESFDVGLFRENLARGFLPVSFGDIVLDSEQGFGIASGDDVILELSRAFRPDLVLFVADVDGVFTADPKRVPAAEFLDVVDAPAMDRISFADPAGADVTGGLRAKIDRMREIARHAGAVRILNGLAKGRLGKAVRGVRVPGTQVVA